MQPVILIFSIDSDISTTNVLKWCCFLDSDIKIIRLHPEDLYNAKIVCKDICGPIHIITANHSFSTHDVRVVWFRKWHLYPQFSDSICKSSSIRQESILNLRDEFFAFFEFLLYQLQQNNEVYWFNDYKHLRINKIQQLLTAKNVGLNIPKTYLETDIGSQYIKERHITKHLSDCFSIHTSKHIYTSYTTRIENVSRNNFVSYIQNEIEKNIEIRVLFINEDCFALALFSQEDPQTQIDYRNYNYNRPTREENFQLPKEITNKITKLMKLLGLNMGVVDLIQQCDGEIVFLEVNPCGQYDNFNLCNIQPDRIIAKHLINKFYEYSEKNPSKDT